MSMQMIMAASQSITRMQTIQSARTQMQGQANILRSESKQDGGDEKKEAQAEALEERSNELMTDLMDEASDAKEILKPDEEIKTEREEKEEVEETPDQNKTDQNKTDTIELSDSAIKHLSLIAPIKSVAHEPVTYKPDGSTRASDFKKNAPAFEITV